MKNLKKLLAMFLLLSVVAAISSCTHQCKEFSAEWENDANNHWHVCIDEDCDATSDVAAHTFNEGTVTTPATEDAEGVKTYKCTVCGYEKTEAIPKLDKVDDGGSGDTPDPVVHTHSLTKQDEVPADCTTAGTEAYYTCSGCDKLFADAEGATEIEAPKAIPAKGHTEEAFGEASEPDCTKAGKTQGKYCSDCGTTIEPQKIIPANGHSFGEGVITAEATCSKAGEKTVTCGVCGETEKQPTEIDPDAHSWNDGKVTTDPTCIAAGEKTYTCKHNSEHTYTEPVAIDENAHSWDEGVVTTDPTCTEQGVKTFTCKNNEAHTKTESVAIVENAHSWNEGVVTTAATCVAAGEKTYTCKHNSEHTYTEPVAIDENAHKASESWSYDEDNHWHVCENGCGDFLDLAAHNPDREEATEENAIMCLDCGCVIEPAKTHVHSFTVLQYSDTEHWYKCTGCEQTDGTEGHYGGEATCIAKAECELCHQPHGSVNSENHTDLKVTEATEPTCTTPGNTEGKQCDACGTVYSTSEVIEALGHKEEAIAGYGATCEATGLTDGKKCTVCDEVTVEQEEIPVKTSHAWGEPVVTIAENVGTATYTCEICGATEQNVGPVLTVTEKHTCDHLTYGVETEYASWTACSVCGAKSYAVTALSAYSGSGVKHSSVAVYNLKDGCTDATVTANMSNTGVTVSDVAVSYNLKSGADKNSSYVEFTYKITAEAATTVNVFVNGRSTNTDSNINKAAKISNFMKLYQGDTEVTISESAEFPAYIEGCNFWVEQQVATVNLAEGDNTFTFRFTKDGGVWMESSKYYGGYISYFRFAEASKALSGCENNVHAIELVPEVSPTCLTDGVKAHYACADCGKIFDTENNLEINEKYLVIPHWNHVYENVARLQDDGTYAYVCTRGCGSTRAHVCDGKTTLIIAREPNLVWYKEGDSFNPDRMEVYLSTACSEGCSGNTVVAGHLIGYDALTYTYQNGESFMAGDEYITINYTVDGATYSANLPVTVTAVDNTLTVDDSSDGYSFIDSESDSRAAGHRKNDQGATGQSAYGGSYSNNFANGDSAKFTFTLEEAKNGANIVLRACSDRMNGAGGYPPYANAISVNDVVIIKVDGVIVEFSDNVIFNGSVTNLDQKTNRWVWTNWMSLDLGTYDLEAGEHTVEIIINTVLDKSIAGCDTTSFTASIQLDCLNVFFK